MFNTSVKSQWGQEEFLFPSAEYTRGLTRVTLRGWLMKAAVYTSGGELEWERFARKFQLCSKQDESNSLSSLLNCQFMRFHREKYFPDSYNPEN
ncbi:hypothetical protein J6590_058847 [Homalodisca vitripennis]|nr:hypothetical protein J6590_058847 [Homalodisca vitripennis]